MRDHVQSRGFVYKTDLAHENASASKFIILLKCTDNQANECRWHKINKTNNARSRITVCKPYSQSEIGKQIFKNLLKMRF